MGVRIITLSLLLTLTGCSSITGSLFGSSDSETPAVESRLGRITVDTPFNQDGIAEALGDGYRLRAGMGMTNNELFSFFQALKETDGKEQVVQTIYGKYDTGIIRIEVVEPGISTGEAEIGTPFSAVFDQAFGACLFDENHEESEITCESGKYKNISYVFAGEWRGPQNLLPDNEVLKDWTVNKIIWNKTENLLAENAESSEQIVLDADELSQLMKSFEG